MPVLQATLPYFYGFCLEVAYYNQLSHIYTLNFIILLFKTYHTSGSSYMYLSACRKQVEYLRKLKLCPHKYSHWSQR